MRTAFGVELPLRALFEAPTVAGLARADGASARAAGREPIPALVRVGGGAEALPLSFAQQRLWFLDQLEPGSAAYNIPVALRLRGALDGRRWSGALDELVRRHEALRTRFASADGVAGAGDRGVGIRWRMEDLIAGRGGGAAEAGRRGLDAGEEARAAVRPGGGSAAARDAAGEAGDDEHVLLLTMHHIVSDGWSMRVLRPRAGGAVRGVRGGRALAAAPSCRSSTPTTRVWQREWLQGEVLERQLAYWRSSWTGAPRAGAADGPSASGRGAAARARRVRLDAVG